MSNELDDRGVKSIEDVPYAKGYVFALDAWREVLAGLDALRNDRGMQVILIAHAAVEKFANANKQHISHDHDGDIVYLTRLQWDIDRVGRDYPDVTLSATKEMMV